MNLAVRDKAKGFDVAFNIPSTIAEMEAIPFYPDALFERPIASFQSYSSTNIGK